MNIKVNNSMFKVEEQGEDRYVVYYRKNIFHRWENIGILGHSLVNSNGEAAYHTRYYEKIEVINAIFMFAEDIKRKFI